MNQNNKTLENQPTQKEIRYILHSKPWYRALKVFYWIIVVAGFISISIYGINESDSIQHFLKGFIRFLTVLVIPFFILSFLIKRLFIYILFGKTARDNPSINVKKDLHKEIIQNTIVTKKITDKIVFFLNPIWGSFVTYFSLTDSNIPVFLLNILFTTFFIYSLSSAEFKNGQIKTTKDILYINRGFGIFYLITILVSIFIVFN